MFSFLGLGADAGIVYHAMIMYPNVGLVELGLFFGWPEERVRRGLEELERRSLIRWSLERPREPVLINPEIGLKDLLSQREEELRWHQQDVRGTQALVESLIAEYDGSAGVQPSLPPQHLIGLDMIRRTIDGLARSCATEVMAFAADGPQTQENMEASRPLDQGLLDRGVRMRSLYLESIANDTSTKTYAQWLADAGAEVRTTVSLPARMAIYDRSVALVAVDPHNSGAGALLLRGTGVVTLLAAYFDQVWETATDLGGLPRRDDEGLTSQEREVLRLLAEGDTDEIVARKLGVSVRTVRRLIADLATRLRARSRFQVGVRAMEEGWLRVARNGRVS